MRIAVVVGVPCGILLGSHRALGSFFEPVLPVLNTVSSAIWAIFAIIWFGLSAMTPIFVVLMTAFPLIVTNVWQGTQAVNADYVELAQALRLSRLKTLIKIYLPSILPFFFSGARLAFGFGWRVSLVAETLGSSSGVGYRLRAGVRPDPDGSGVRLDDRAGRDDAGDRDSACCSRWSATCSAGGATCGHKAGGDGHGDRIGVGRNETILPAQLP